MPEIRPLERSDLAQVAELYEQVMRSGARTAPHGLASSFERTFFDQPWADSECPSLVYVDERGAIGGFIGTSVRRMRLGDELIRVCVSGHLVVEPRVRGRAVGMFLMRECMSGPQELTLTDGATVTVSQIWQGLGGEPFQLGCVEWLRVFRPGAVLRQFIRGRGRNRIGSALRPVWPVIDRSASLGRPGSLKPMRPASDGRPMDAGSLIEHLPKVAAPFRLSPAYDAEFLDWLFAELSAVTERGTLISRIVRAQEGRVLGWYLYYLPGRGIGHVLQIAGAGRDVDAVVADLFFDAWRRGAAGVRGRVEGHTRQALSSCLFRPAGALALIHARDHEILHVIQSGRALLTRLDGEWWMGHQVKVFGSQPSEHVRKSV